MKKLKLFMAAMIAAITFAGMSGVSAAAQAIDGSAATGAHSFTITREVHNVTNPVTNTFTYTIAAESGPAGGVTGAPTTATVAFSAVSPSDGVATQTGTIDFANAHFTKNGDYVWTVTETASTDGTNYPVDASHTYKIKASVRNSQTTNLSPNQTKSLVFFRLDSNGAKLGDNDKMLFTSESQFEHITVSKEVTGAMGDVDQYFDVVVSVDGTPGDSYTISGQTASGAPSVCTVASGATSCSATIKIKHSETVTIGSNGGVDQIPVGTHYTVSEAVPTDYIGTVNGGTATPAGSTATSGQKTVNTTSNANTIVNNYEGETVTGVFLRVLPYIVIVAMAIAGVIYLIVRNKKQKEAEE